MSWDNRLAFLLRETPHAPLRLLFPLTVIAGTILGFGLGLALGVITDALAYYVIKETLLGAIGGLTAPLFLLLIRQRRVSTRPLSYLRYYLAGALAGVVIIGAHFLFPARIPPGVWLVLYVLGAAGLFPLIGLFADYVQEQRDEHARTKEIFGKYVSESIARRILAEQAAVMLGGEKREATVLISDIRGFTRMIQDLGAEEVVNTLNEYFARMIDIIFQFDGTVNKFIGDAMVVLYGVPLSSGDENWRALETALAMQREVASMNGARAASGRPLLHIGIAIDAGQVVCGNIGSPRRMEYTAIGAPVNTAYQLASLAAPDTIYLTQNVYRALSGRISVREAGTLALKGGTGDLNIYVLDTLEAPSDPLANLQSFDGSMLSAAELLSIAQDKPSTLNLQPDSNA